jgi:1-phosphatidylinositol-3-phosphate 5-kinase
VRSFFHRGVRVNLAVLPLPSEVAPRLEAAGWNCIQCWTRCRVCGACSRAQPLGQDAWRFSFGKWLELLFYDTQLQGPACSHSLHRQHSIYFALRGLVAHVVAQEVVVREVVVPPLVLAYDPQTRTRLAVREFDEVQEQALQFYAAIATRLSLAVQEADALMLAARPSSAGLAAERLELDAWVQQLTAFHRQETELFFGLLEEARAQLARPPESGQPSPAALALFETNRLRRRLLVNAATWNASLQELSIKRARLQALLPALSAAAAGPSTTPSSAAAAAAPSRSPLLSPIPVAASSSAPPSPRASPIHTPAEGSAPALPPHQLPSCPAVFESAALRTSSSDAPEPSAAAAAAAAAAASVPATVLAAPPPQAPASPAPSPSVIRVSTQAADLDGGEESGSGGGEAAGRSGALAEQLKKALSQLLPAEGAGMAAPAQALLSPEFLAAGRSLLHLPAGPGDRLIVVRPDEPGSILAYALTSAAYAEQTSGRLGPGMGQRPWEAPLVSGPALHAEVRAVSSNLDELRCAFNVTVYHAVQFHALRRLACPAGWSEEDFVASVARGRSWEARGGKSGSRFSKSLDERLIVKQVSKVELLSFLEFAPLYFGYVAKAVFLAVPTALAKILAVFTVSIKAAEGGTRSGVKQHFVVIENLFYGRTISQVYDLKGSLRSRYVKPTSDAGPVVWMDENLLENLYAAPLCVSEQAKAELAHAVRNDTVFLSSVDVMDYSLLVGVDLDTQELVVGIIDYMRKYTWDKQLETWVKRSGIMGKPGRDPTIISPKQYKTRFREAMQQVPLCCLLSVSLSLISWLLCVCVCVLLFAALTWTVLRAVPNGGMRRRFLMHKMYCMYILSDR